MLIVSNVEPIDDIWLKLNTLYLLKLCTELYTKSLSYLTALLPLSSFLILFLKPYLMENTHLTFLTTPGLFPNFSSAKYSNLPSYLDDNAEY